MLKGWGQRKAGWLNTQTLSKASVTLTNDPNLGLIFGLLGPETGLCSTQRGVDILGWVYPNHLSTYCPLTN